jgi:hypothetical protein
MNRYSLLLLIGILSGTLLDGQSAGINATTGNPSAPVNNVANYPGADLCAKVNAAIASLGPGAVIDARSFSGTQTCSANVVFSASNITLLLSGDLRWQLGSYMLFASGNVGGIRILGGGRPIGSSGQQPGCVKSPELGRGTCIFSTNATAVIQLGDGTNTWTKTKGMNPATDDVVADLTVIQNSATGDGYLLEGTFDAELEDVGAWDLYHGNTGAAFHEFGVITPTGSSSTTCAWEWGTQVYHPNFGAFHRGWYEESPTDTGSCLPYIGTDTGGNNQFYGGFIGGAKPDGIGIDWAGPLSEQNWVFGTDVETSNICLHLAGNENRFYGRLESSNCTISVQLDGSLKGAQGNVIEGVYHGPAISIINGAHFDNNLFWTPDVARLGPTGDFSILSLSDTPQTIRFGSGKTTNQTTALELGTTASGSFVPWAKLVMNMTNPNGGLEIRDQSGANRFHWWGSNTDLAGTSGGGILIDADKNSGTAGLSVFSGGAEPVRWSQLTNGLMLSGDPPKVSNGEIGFGAKTVPATSCGSLPGASGCIAVNINGSLHYVPYW